MVFVMKHLNMLEKIYHLNLLHALQVYSKVLDLEFLVGFVLNYMIGL
jgi:hypothetical protein